MREEGGSHQETDEGGIREGGGIAEGALGEGGDGGTRRLRERERKG